MIRLVIWVFAPTAAMPMVPSEPIRRPIITVSIRLLSCSRMLVRATGMAKRSTFVQRFPVRNCIS
ncbi:hypothetical protein [Parafannyhessea umbonata]|uniref:hypothetical protein n=1 Tax=Parafannyhessea umbonata TaxID=604330 RepID=UPI003AB721E1